MKAFLKILAVTLLLTAPQLFGDNGIATSQDVRTRNFTITQAPNVKPDEILRVALPTEAKVILKGGGSMSGRVTQIDSQNLLIQRSSTKPIPLSQIEEVIFSEKALVFRFSGPPVIRGDGVVPAATPAILNIPLNAFRMQDPVKGQAEVKLGSSVVPRGRLRGILAVAKDRQYVVENIKFNLPQNMMTILATPY